MKNSDDNPVTASSPEDNGEMWRSLDELERAPDFEDWLHREFPREAAVWPDGLDRRSFLQVAGASLALGGLTACTRQPLEKIVPYAQQVEQLVPGEPLYFATGYALDGYSTGILAESHMGRPTKIEGSPEHPASLGATDLLAQAEVLSLYDPDRSKVIRQLGRIRTWNMFVEETRRAVQALEALDGARIRILSETVTSPSLAAEIQRVLETYPKAGWVQYDPAGRDTVRGGTERAFGMPLDVSYDFSRADVVLSLDSDFLTVGPGHIPYARAFAARRKVDVDTVQMNRLYAIETSPTLTGTMADHRLSSSSQGIARFAAALAGELGVDGITGASADGPEADWVDAVAEDLSRHAGRSLVVAGDQAPAAVQVLAHAINAHLGNLGETVHLTKTAVVQPVDQTEAIAKLVEEMNAGEVDVLLILSGNPVYNAPADLAFKDAIVKVPRRIRLGLYEDETSEYCQWHIPQAHFLETWGDGRAFDGTVTLQQPLIEPLYSGRSASELLSIFGEDDPRPAEEILKGYWESNLAQTNGDFESAWRKSLHDGWIPGTEAAAVEAQLLSGVTTRAAVEASQVAPPSIDSPELAFRPDPTIWDGRYANNAWLQECPKPFTRLTWDNALLVSPAFAQNRGLETGQLVDLSVGDRVLETAVWIHPGQADGTLTLHLGYGRSKAGGNGSGPGFNAYELRTTKYVWHARGVKVEPRAGEHYEFASTQRHHNMELETVEAEKRHLVRSGSISQYREDPEFVQHMVHTFSEEMSLFPAWDYEGHAWGLSVDLSACTGCNACVVACQAENNIPVVGKDQVALGREMHWIRVDRYYQGSLHEPSVHHQPVMCMHCEQAPCEVVCPVAATVHSDEGLNDMVYNRCVGTRYCANNCPYKVRRFNFLLYNEWETPVLKLLRNPDVTVRSRGVMEKCSYCVQRIKKVTIAADREQRSVIDGEIRTACQQVCPSEAITFGDLNDEASAAARQRAEPRNYGILEDLNTRPRTTYMAKITNPNPVLSPADDDHGEQHG